MSNEDFFVEKFINHDFQNNDTMIQYLKDNNLYKGTTLKVICKKLKNHNNNSLKIPGCTNKKLEYIIDSLKNIYESSSDTQSLLRIPINMKGQEIIVLTTQDHADQLQNIIDKDISLHSRLESLESQIIEQQSQIKDLMSTLDTVMKENIMLKQNSDCRNNYNCSDEESCNIHTGQCEQEQEQEVDEEDELEQFITEDGHKYIGNKQSIEKIKERIRRKQDIINNAQQNISFPEELNESNESETDTLINTISQIEQNNELRLQNKIQFILNNS